MRRNWTIGQKLTISFGIVLALTGLLSYSSLGTIRRLGMIEVAANENAKAADLLGAIGVDLMEMKAVSRFTQFCYVATYILKVDEHKNKMENLPNGGDCAMCHAFGSADSRKADFTAAAEKAKKHVAQLHELVRTPTARKSLAAMGDGIEEWQRIFSEYLGLATQGAFGSAHTLVTDQMGPLLERINQSAKALSEEQNAFMATSRAAASESISHSRWMAALLMGLCLACGVVIALVIRRISLLLRELAQELKERAGRVAGDASRVVESGRALARAACDQAASIEETSASSQQVKATARQNTDHSSKVAELIGGVRRQFGETLRVLDQTVTAMAGIDDASHSISKIIKVIDEIAFQTNILALNAAVEAARAGEAGAGFAVVADEVRRLARRCADAAKETGQLIEASVTRSNEGKTRLDQLTLGIHAITQATDSVSALSDQVRTGSMEQASATEEIGKALLRIEQVTQKTTATADDSATAGEQLSAESAELQKVVGRLSALTG